MLDFFSVYWRLTDGERIRGGLWVDTIASSLN